LGDGHDVNLPQCCGSGNRSPDALQPRLGTAPTDRVNSGYP
jgi:hypothetical protein